MTSDAAMLDRVRWFVNLREQRLDQVGSGPTVLRPPAYDRGEAAPLLTAAPVEQADGATAARPAARQVRAWARSAVMEVPAGISWGRRSGAPSSARTPMPDEWAALFRPAP